MAHPELTTDAYLAVIHREVASLATCWGSGSDLAVPSCPGWDLRALIRHVGIVHRWVERIVRTRAQQRVPLDEIPRPSEDADMAAWLLEGADGLLDAFGGVELDMPMWNWSGVRQVAGFWPRRMAHETAVHRWDGENAVGEAAPVEPEDLAVDGISEIVEAWLPSWAADNPTADLGGCIELVSREPRRSWTFAIRAGYVVLDDGSPDARAEGAPSDLLLFAFGRLDADVVAVQGDTALLERWRSCGWSQ